MSDATRATPFDDLGSELNVFDTTTNRFVFRYVDFERTAVMMGAARGWRVTARDRFA